MYTAVLVTFDLWLVYSQFWPVFSFDSLKLFWTYFLYYVSGSFICYVKDLSLIYKKTWKEHKNTRTHKRNWKQNDINLIT